MESEPRSELLVSRRTEGDVALPSANARVGVDRRSAELAGGSCQHQTAPRRTGLSRRFWIGAKTNSLTSGPSSRPWHGQLGGFPLV